jgi:hypothetical protein
MGKKYNKNKKGSEKNNQNKPQAKPENPQKDNSSEEQKDDSPKNKDLKLPSKNKKKIAIPLKKLKLEISDEEIQLLNLQQLKVLANKFDLNPLINFRLLYLLKNSQNIKDQEDYKKYIKKYRYTLNYEDAIKLKCFNDSENTNYINEFLSNLDNNKNYSKFKPDLKITSLSKIKLFNLLFYIISIKKEIDVEDYIEPCKIIINKIESYSNEENLIFKVPNNFGNIELQYYVFITLFLNYFLRNIKHLLLNCFPNNNEIKEPAKDIFFDWETNIEGKEEEIDMSFFEKRKKNLEIFIDKAIDNKSKTKNIYMEIDKQKELSDNIKKEEFKKEYLQNVFTSFIFYDVSRLKKYKDNIIDLAFEKDNDIILKKIEFIFYSLLFTDKHYNSILDNYANCLFYDNDERNEKLKNNIKSHVPIKLRDPLKLKELVNINLDCEFKNRNNKIICDNSKYYKFPSLLHQNIIESNNNIFQLFKDFLKYIYNSQILKDIFYLTPEFNDFKYPLEDQEIFDEMMENIIFIPFKSAVLHGYTQKQFSRVIIAISLSKEDFYRNEISKIINDLSSILNTLIHEQFKHYIKGLIFYNSFRFKITKRIDSDLSAYEQDKTFMEKIRFIYLSQEPEIYKSPIIDGGFRAEIYLYGQILSKIYFSQAYDMFKFSTWKLSIEEHLQKFNQNNQEIKEKDKLIIIENLKNDLDTCDFIKNILQEINVCLECNGVLKFDLSFYSSYRQKEYKKEINEPGTLLFDYSEYKENTIVIRPDTEFDQSLAYKFIEFK